MGFDNLSPEQIERAKACTSPEELKEIAREGKLELSLDDLEGAAGGYWFECWKDENGEEGDERADVDPVNAHEAYKRGEIGYADLDWYFDAHPTVQFAHPGGNFSARWFAGAFYFAEDPWPETVCFADDAEYRAWLDRIAQDNRLSCPLAPGTDDRVLVCCTCSQAPGEHDPDRYALFAVIEN